jgi:hypothetical protein
MLMGRKKYKGAGDKRDGGQFLAVPFIVLNGRAYIELNAHAKMLLWDIAAQYKGNNNGDLCAAWKFMKARGWKSEDTLNKAKRELLASGLIAETRKGARPNKATLYGLTWCDLDDCGGKLDISQNGFPRGAYRLHDYPPQAVKNELLATAGVFGGAR